MLARVDLHISMQINMLRRLLIGLFLPLFLFAAAISAATPSVSYVGVHFLCPTPVDDLNNPPSFLHSTANPFTTTRGSQVAAYLVVNITPSDASGNVYFMSTGSLTLAQDKLLGVSSGGNNVYVPLIFQENLPNSVQTKDLNITFSWRNGLTGSWSTLGTCSTKVYITYDAPLTSFPGTTISIPFYRSIFKVACQVSGATTSAQTVGNMWGAFLGRTLQTFGGAPLKYYESGTYFPDSFPSLQELLYYRRGNCTAFSEFLIYCFWAHGITGFDLINAKTYDYPYKGFVIKNWLPVNGGTLPPPFKYRVSAYFDPGYFDMNYGQGGDLYTIGGLPGQNSSTPSEKVFTEHNFLYYPGLYYDPSYGVTYFDAADMESQVLYGIWGNSTSRLDGTLVVRTIDVRLPSGGDILF